jgi:transcription initiation factor TFIID TATA-box-binding protein
MRKRKYCPLSHSVASRENDNAPLPTVHNIVATSQIASSVATFDLNAIHAMLPFSFYDQQRFAAITVRLHNPECTTLLFSSGKLVVTGCRTWYHAVYASLFMARLLEECMPGHTFRLVACDVQNMVAHVEVPVHGGYLDLQGMYSRMAINCTYQRKMFPGLIYRPESSPVVLLCFFSGKIVITGGKTMDDMYSGWRRLWPVIQPFVRPPSQGGEHQQGLPLKWHAVAHQPGGAPNAVVEPAGGGARGREVLDLAQPAKVQRLGDDLATKRGPLGLRAGVAAGAGAEGPPHAPVVKHDALGGDGPAVF